MCNELQRIVLFCVPCYTQPMDKIYPNYITIITVFAFISSLGFARVAFGSETKNFESVDKEFHELIRQGSKLGILQIVMSDVK